MEIMKGHAKDSKILLSGNGIPKGPYGGKVQSKIGL